jgi:hypothetical protein
MAIAIYLNISELRSTNLTCLHPTKFDSLSNTIHRTKDSKKIRTFIHEYNMAIDIIGGKSDYIPISTQSDWSDDHLQSKKS